MQLQLLSVTQSLEYHPLAGMQTEMLQSAEDHFDTFQHSLPDVAAKFCSESLRATY